MACKRSKWTNDNNWVYTFNIDLNGESADESDLYSIIKQCRYDAPIRFSDGHCEDCSIPFDVKLNIRNITDIKDALKNYFSTSIIEGNTCEYCKQKCGTHVKRYIMHLPKYLVIRLSRFNSFEDPPSKNEKEIVNNLDIDLKIGRAHV